MMWKCDPNCYGGDIMCGGHYFEMFAACQTTPIHFISQCCKNMTMLSLDRVFKKYAQSIGKIFYNLKNSLVEDKDQANDEKDT